MDSFRVSRGEGRSRRSTSSKRVNVAGRSSVTNTTCVARPTSRAWGESGLAWISVRTVVPSGGATASSRSSDPLLILDVDVHRVDAKVGSAMGNVARCRNRQLVFYGTDDVTLRDR
jgi:hypothetical protein